jgi:dynactin 1
MDSTNLLPSTIVELKDGRLATVRYFGDFHLKPGPPWVGIELEDATGKNDGSIQGHRYFQCAPNHGMFLQPSGIAGVVESASRSTTTGSTSTTGANSKTTPSAPNGRTTNAASDASRTKLTSRASNKSSNNNTDLRRPGSGLNVSSSCTYDILK